jgi:hypothetical protein
MTFSLPEVCEGAYNNPAQPIYALSVTLPGEVETRYTDPSMLQTPTIAWRKNINENPFIDYLKYVVNVATCDLPSTDSEYAGCLPEKLC